VFSRALLMMVRMMFVVRSTQLHQHCHDAKNKNKNKNESSDRGGCGVDLCSNEYEVAPVSIVRFLSALMKPKGGL
jgi:hypothetical protein